MLALPSHHYVARQRLTLWEAVIERLLRLTTNISGRGVGLVFAKVAVRYWEGAEIRQRRKNLCYAQDIQARAANIIGAGNGENLIQNITLLINLYSRKRKILERVAVDVARANMNVDKALQANQESLTALYDTLRLVKKLKPKTVQATSEVAKQAVSRTSNTLRKLYAR